MNDGIFFIVSSNNVSQKIMIGINLYDSGNFLFIIFTIFCLYLSREIGSSTRNLNILWGQINAKLNLKYLGIAFQNECNNLGNFDLK